MAPSTYTITLMSPAGYALVGIDRFTRMEMGRSVNGSGALTLAMAATFPASYLQSQCQLEVLRTPTDRTNPMPVLGTRWLLNSYTHFDDGAGGQYQMRFESVADVMQRRIIAYPAASDQASKTGAVDNIMKALVRENMGALATDRARDLSAYLAVAADTSSGPVVSKAFAWRQLATVLAELVNAAALASEPANVFWDVVWDELASVFEFRTYIGQRGRDRGQLSSAPMVFSVGSRNVLNPRLTTDWSREINYAYVGGQGEESARAIVQVSDPARILATPFSRSERFVDARQYSSTAGLADEGAAAIRAGRVTTTFEADVHNATGSEFQVDWDFGDKVVAQGFDQTWDCWINSVQIVVAGGSESISARLRGVS